MTVLWRADILDGNGFVGLGAEHDIRLAAVGSLLHLDGLLEVLANYQSIDDYL